MMRLTIHLARRCPCGAGAAIPGAVGRLVAERAPIASVELTTEAELDRAEIPGAVARPVRCWSCGLEASAEGAVIAVDGQPVGYDPLADLLPGGRFDAAEREHERNLAARLGPVGPVPDALPEDVE